MANKTKKTILITLAVLVTVGVSASLYLYNKGPREIKSCKGIKVNSNELYSVYSTDSLEAKKKYTDKVLEVNGIVSEVSTNLQQQKIILIKTNTEGAHINCTLEEAAENIQVNAPVTIKGLASGIGQGDADLGILGDVYLTRCYVVQSDNQ